MAHQSTPDLPSAGIAVSPLGQRRQRRFYLVMGGVATLVAVAGFGESFYAVATGVKKLTPLVHLHAAVFSGWLVLYLVQTGLVTSGRVAVHQWLGIAGVVLAVAVVVVGYQTAITAARNGYDLRNNNDPLGFLAFTLGDLLSFAVLVPIAIRYRNRPEVHKRLMLLVTVGPMLSAALVHVWLPLPNKEAQLPLFLVSMVALLFAGAVHDRVTLGRFHPVSLWVAVALFVWGNLRAVLIGPSDAWHRIAAWLIQ
jgi:hypothetical protein